MPGLAALLPLAATPAMEPDDWVYAHQVAAGSGAVEMVVTRFLTTETACRKQTDMSAAVGSTLPRHPDGGELTVSRNGCSLVKISEFLDTLRQRYRDGARLHLPEGSGFIVFLTPRSQASLDWCRRFALDLEMQYWQEGETPETFDCLAM